MSLDQDIYDQARGFFLVEAPQLLEEIERELLLLPKEKNVQRVHSLMRAAHSLKGGAATVGFDTIKQVSHRLEDVFKALYADKPLDAQTEQGLFAGFDALKGLVLAEVEQRPIDKNAVLAQAEQAFSQLETHLGAAMGQEILLSSEDLGVDMTASVFREDVEEQLMQWEEESQAGTLTADDVLARTDVLVGLGQLTGATGFEQLAEVLAKAIRTNPQAVNAISALGLRELRQSQYLVLNGQPLGGNGASPTLKQYTKKLPIVSVAETPLSTSSTPVTQLYEATPPPPTLWQRLRLFVTNLLTPPAALTPTPLPVRTKQVSWTEQPTVSVVIPIPEPEPELASEPAREEPVSPMSLDDIFADFTPTTPTLVPEFTEAAYQEEPFEDALESFWSDVEVPVEDTYTASEQLWEQAIAPEPEPATPLSLDNLSTVFASLPPATDLRPPVAEPLPVPLSPAAPVAAQERRPQLRVDAERIERLNNLVGELVINRNGLALNHEQLLTTLQDTLDRAENLQEFSRNLQDISDKLLVAPTRLTDNALFDSLEFDRYSKLHGLMQEVIEGLGKIQESTGDLLLITEQSGFKLQQHQRMLKEVRDDLMWSRMLPLGEIFNRIPRLLRDLSTKYAKPVEFQLKGQEVLMDKSAIEKLYTPLVHLVRNAFDHGIEPALHRAAQQKPEVGTIHLLAYHQGNQTIIEIRDDGKGLDTAKIAQRAIALGLVSAEQVTQLTADQIAEYIFEPGFSTAETVSDLSGRGVGLDVVRLEVQALKGTVSVTSTPGQGTTFFLRLPLTLTIAKLLVFTAGGRNYALPLEDIREILIPQANHFQQSGHQRLLKWRERLVPVQPLTQALGYAETTVRPFAPVLILQAAGQVLALTIEQFITEQELAIKPFGTVFQPPAYLYGCTVLGDGTLVPVIDGATLLRQVLGSTTSVLSSSLSPKALPAPPTPKAQPVLATTILVVDDSLVQRQTLTLSLQKAGYQVCQAKDGQEALLLLQRQPQIPLVLCDIEMPTMDGFEFLSACRKDPQLNQPVVVMVTSRTSAKHRQEAQRLGAAGYLNKPFDQQELLTTVRQLLTERVVAGVA